MPVIAEIINSIIELGSQIVGGLLVLYSIDSNLGIMRGNGILNEVVVYIKSFPLMTKPTTMNVSSTESSYSSGSVKVETKNIPKTIQEEIEHLKEDVAHLRQEVNGKFTELNKIVDHNYNDDQDRYVELQKYINETKYKVEKISIGGIKVQFVSIQPKITKKVLDSVFG
ncbi:hypothetical protein [Nitrincola sp. MINF-07-Sa-05]|uniref:hypothetical protein n=1 Tax=Nitrincola salilacus TaxID=3400273 RepID=UPI0039180B6E